MKEKNSQIKRKQILLEGVEPTVGIILCLLGRHHNQLNISELQLPEIDRQTERQIDDKC